MKLLSFAASNSRHSINKTLVAHAANLAQELGVATDVEILDLNDFEMPLYSIDREIEAGIPELARTFRDKIAAADALIISFAMHNGSYTVAYKNVFDWASRLEGKVYEGKPVIVFAASPGPNGAIGMAELAAESMPYFGATVLGSLAVPHFNEAFDTEQARLHDGPLADELKQLLVRLGETAEPA